MPAWSCETLTYLKLYYPKDMGERAPFWSDQRRFVTVKHCKALNEAVLLSTRLRKIEHLARELAHNNVEQPRNDVRA